MGLSRYNYIIGFNLPGTAQPRYLKMSDTIIPADIIERCQKDPKHYPAEIRRIAKHEGYIAHKSRLDGLWRFGDAESDTPQSPAMSDGEALAWIMPL